MARLVGQGEEPITATGNPHVDPADRAGLRGRHASRPAGLATPNEQDVAGSLGREPNGDGMTIPHLLIPAAEVAREHVSHPIDIHVGARMRLRRQLLGMSQEKLAGELGITVP